MYGLGVLINLLSDNGERSRAALEAAQGAKITALEISSELYRDGALILTFEGGTRLAIYDYGRSCCEDRYMMTDDNLDDFVGSLFYGVELRNGEVTEGEWGYPHETAFLIVNTSIGSFTCVTHNVHDGYYGGFWMRCDILGDDE